LSACLGERERAKANSSVIPLSRKTLRLLQKKLEASDPARLGEGRSEGREGALKEKETGDKG